MRQGELFALTWADFDFEFSTIRINKTHSYVKDIESNKRVNYVTNTKTKKSNRIIPMAQRTRNILMNHLREQKIMLFKIGIIQSDETLVFGTPVNTSLDSSNVLQELKKVYASIGINDKTFHDLRHTYATRLFDTGRAGKNGTGTFRPQQRKSDIGNLYPRAGTAKNKNSVFNRRLV